MSEPAGELPSKDDFSCHLNTPFRATFQEQEFDASLIKVEDFSNAVQENFSLLFRFPTDAPPSQGIYRLEDDTLGTHDLFLVPVKRDADGLYCEAVFNRFLPAEPGVNTT